jgi:hypothetical protein
MTPLAETSVPTTCCTLRFHPAPLKCTGIYFFEEEEGKTFSLLHSPLSLSTVVSLSLICIMDVKFHEMNFSGSLKNLWCAAARFPRVAEEAFNPFINYARPRRRRRCRHYGKMMNENR